MYTIASPFKREQERRRKGFVWLFHLFFFPVSFFCFCFLASNLSFSGRSHLESLLTSKEQKKVGSWPVWYFGHACRPCSWRHWQWLLGAKWKHSTFKRRFLANMIRNRVKNCCVSVLYSIPIDSVRDTSSLWVLFKPEQLKRDCGHLSSCASTETRKSMVV